MPAKVIDVPEWADSKTVKESLVAMAGYEMPEDFGQVELVPVTNFSTMFAEWTMKGKDLLVHLFPRAGGDDRWYPSRLRDGKYIPSRREEKSNVEFPSDMVGIIKSAVDKAWMGDVAIDLIPELGAYIVQFQGAKSTVKLVSPDKFVDTFCEVIDERLEPTDS